MGLRGDAISSFDWTVGEVLAALEEAGVSDNTLLIITSDNGPVIDDGYQDNAFELLNGHQPTGGLRGDKYSNFEGGTMVPMIVRWPARVKPQSEENNTLMSLIDIFGSMGALLNAELPKGAAPDSGDMLAQMLGESKEHRPWVSELGQRNTMCVRTDRWKYIPAGGSNGTLSWNATGHDGKTIDTGDRTVDQLYDMVNDLNETTNVASQYPEILEQMKAIHVQAAATHFDMPLMSVGQDTHWYNIYTPLRDNLHLRATSATAITGVNAEQAVYAASQWKFVEREDGTVDIINRDNNSYINPGSASNTEALQLSKSAPDKGWVIDYANTPDCMVFYTQDKSAQMNQGGSNRNFLLLNWGGGRHDDNGCQFAIKEVTAEPKVEIVLPTDKTAPIASTEEDPHWFTMRTPSRDNRYVTVDENTGLIGTLTTTYSPALTWRFEERTDGSFNIISQATGEYIAPATVAGSKQISLTSTVPDAGWTFKPAGTSLYAIVSGTIQLNQTNSNNNFKIFNWGSGTNTSDVGCLYCFTDITDLLNGEQDGITITKAPQVAPTRYVDLLGRPVANPRHGIFITSEGRKIIL